MTAAAKLLWQLSVRNIARYRRRNIMLFLAIAIAVAGVSGMNTLIRGMQADMRRSAVENLSGHLKVVAPGYRDDPSIERGFALDGRVPLDLPPDAVMGWAPRIIVPAVVMSERETRGIQLVGVEPPAERISFLADVPVLGERLANADDPRILIGAQLARDLETDIGRRVVVITQGSDGRNREKGYRVSGTYDAEGTGLEKVYAFTGLANLQQLLDSDEITEISIRFTEQAERSAGAEVSFQHALANAMNRLEVLTWQQLNPQAAAMFLFADTAIYVWFLLMMSALAFGLVNTLVASVMERVTELGILRALGMNRRLVVAQVVLESTLIMAIGVMIGLVAGYGVYLWLQDGIDLTQWSAGMEMAGMSAIWTPQFRAADFLLVAGMSLVLGVLASLYPAWRAVRVKPLDALRFR